MRGDRGVPVRVEFTKRGRVRFISHRDVARSFDRAFRVERIPLAFTQGFVPRPRVSFGLGLLTGHESEAEYLDVEMTEEVDLERFAQAVTTALPEGMAVTAAKFLESRALSLQQSVTSVEYHVEAWSDLGAAPDPSDVAAWVQHALQAEALPALVRRNGKVVEDDLRPGIRDLRMVEPTSRGVTLQMEVSTQPRSVKVSEVLALLGPGGVLNEERVVRTRQWIERDGSRRTPLEADTRERAGAGAP